MTYLSLSDPAFEVVFDERRTERLGWHDENGRRRDSHRAESDFRAEWCDPEEATMTAPRPSAEPSLPLVVTQLMKGPLYYATHEKPWQQLLRLQAQVRDYVRVIGLTVVVDESEGYAFLRSRPDLDDELPRLIPRRALSFHVGLLLALLRKKLAEADVQDGATRLILTRDQIVEMVRLFQPKSSNEARLVDQIGKVVELGFLRKVKDQPAYEVRRILKAFVDGQWLSELMLTAKSAGQGLGSQTATSVSASRTVLSTWPLAVSASATATTRPSRRESKWCPVKWMSARPSTAPASGVMSPFP